MSKTLQGGRRPGSGRPRKGTERRVSISITISQSAADKLRQMRKAGIHINDMLEERIIEEYRWHLHIFDSPLAG